MTYFFLEPSRLLCLATCVIIVSKMMFLFSFLLSVSASDIKKLFSYSCESGPYKDTSTVLNLYKICKVLTSKIYTLKDYFEANIQGFCFYRPKQIFLCFCVLYFLFLYFNLNMNSAVLLFSCTAFLYAPLYFLLKLQIPVVEFLCLVTLMSIFFSFPIKSICIFFSWFFLDVFSFINSLSPLI